MDDFITDQVLEVFDTVRDENTKAIKLDILEHAMIVYPSVMLVLHLTASGIITKRPKRYFNKFTSTDDFGDIVRYFHGNYSEIPINTLRLIQIMHDPRALGVARGDIITLLAHTEPLDVYSLMGSGEEICSCDLCGDPDVTSQGLCNYCYDTLESLTEFRSEENITVELTHNNYKRHTLLNKGHHVTANLKYYAVHVCQGVAEYSRYLPIYDAKLPFEEYQVPLS